MAATAPCGSPARGGERSRKERVLANMCGAHQSHSKGRDFALENLNPKARFLLGRCCPGFAVTRGVDWRAMVSCLLEKSDMRG